MGTKSKAQQNSHPKEQSKGGRHCRVCANQHGIIRKYHLNMCRQCFRCYAKDIGFIKGGCVVCVYFSGALGAWGKGLVSVVLGVFVAKDIYFGGV